MLVVLEDEAGVSVNTDLVIGYGVRNVTDYRELTHGVACVGIKAVVVKVIGYWACSTLIINLARAHVEHSTEANIMVVFCT